MKKQVLFLAIFFVAATMTTNATIWRVNNAAGVDADFDNLQIAIDTAIVLPFDTLYVEGSTTNYGDITVNKPLVFIGPGYFLNANDSTQAIKKQAKLGLVIFNSTSAGSKMMGFYLTGSNYEVVRIDADNIHLERNRIYYIVGYYGQLLKGIHLYSDNLTGIVIKNNYIHVKNTSTSGSGGHHAAAIYSNKNGLSLLIICNYIKAEVSYYYNTVPWAIYLSGTPGYNYLINNNVLQNNVTLNQGNFTNNIMIIGTISGSLNTFLHNIGNSTQFPTGNGNQQNVVMTTVFVDHTSGVDNGLLLVTGSPAIGAGINGEDCGIFGGPNPYVLSGIPPVPSIFEIIHSGVGTTGIPLQVNLKAKSNN